MHGPILDVWLEMETRNENSDDSEYNRTDSSARLCRQPGSTRDDRNSRWCQAAPIAVTGDWTGGYVGGQLGYGNVECGGTDGDGAFGGLHAGYQSDMGTFVVGGEVDYDFADIKLDGGAGTIDNIAPTEAARRL